MILRLTEEWKEKLDKGFFAGVVLMDLSKAFPKPLANCKLNAYAYFSNLKKVNSQQKHSVRIIYNKMKYESVRELLISLKILNVYQINILNNASFMHRINTKTAPTVFLSKFTKPSHIYPTRFSQINYAKSTHKLNRCKYRISIRGPYIWNEFLSNKEKEIELTSSFKSTTKSKLLSLNNDIPYF